MAGGPAVAVTACQASGQLEQLSLSRYTVDLRLSKATEYLGLSKSKNKSSEIRRSISKRSLIVRNLELSPDSGVSLSSMKSSPLSV